MKDSLFRVLFFVISLTGHLVKQFPYVLVDHFCLREVFALGA